MGGFLHTFLTLAAVVPGASVNYDVVLLKLVKLSGDLRLEEKQEGLLSQS